MSCPLSNELLEFCQSDSLSEEGLRQIIERHGSGSVTRVNHIGSYKFFHEACRNGSLTEGIIRCLLENFPDAVSSACSNGRLHCVWLNPNVTLNIIKLLIDAAPDSVRSVNNFGSMPLHHLCRNKDLDDAIAIQFSKLLIEKYPAAVRHANNKGYLPIHIASGNKSPEFCRVLIEAYPGSERMITAVGELPLHRACRKNTFAAVEYLYKLYPDAINHTTTTIRGGLYPIHFAISSVGRSRDELIAAVDIVKYLLDCSPIVKLQKFGGIESLPLLHFACCLECNDSTIDVGIQMIQVIYDAHPEAIEEDCIASSIQDYDPPVRAFINSQLDYARQAKNHRLMTTPDSNGQLPLHKALQNNVRLGSIKLLVKGYPPAVQSPDNRGALPLHIACQHHESASIVQYLVGLDATTLDAVDEDGNTALHLACHFARHEIIALLLDEFDAVSVSKRNSRKKLPIDLLWESNEVGDKESVEYTESVFRLLTAYPETVMNIGIQKQPSAPANCPSSNGKKRKFGNE
eukprot:scaffold12136_cov114-Skeletonema_dohrnii-CCMP3373.AAC.2